MYKEACKGLQAAGWRQQKKVLVFIMCDDDALPQPNFTQTPTSSSAYASAAHCSGPTESHYI